MKTSLTNLSRALAGAAPSNPIYKPPSPIPTMLDIVDENNVHKIQSISKWSRELNIPIPTILYRLKKGWTDEQTLNFAPPPARNRSGEQLQHVLSASKVLVTKNNIVISRAEAARALGIRLDTLAQRLRQHRSPSGEQVRVELSSLVPTRPRRYHTPR